MSAAEKTDMTGEEILSYTQRVRLSLINKITNGGESMPEDPKDRMALLSTLDGIDRQELGKLKIDAKQNNSATERLVAAALTNLIGAGLNGRNPFLHEEKEGAPAPVREAPTMPEAIVQELTLVPGETRVGLQNENLATFAKRTGMDLGSIPGASSEHVNEEFANDGK